MNSLHGNSISTNIDYITRICAGIFLRFEDFIWAIFEKDKTPHFNQK